MQVSLLVAKGWVCVMGKRERQDIEFIERIKSHRTQLVSISFRRLPVPSGQAEIEGHSILRMTEFSPERIMGDLEVSVSFDPTGVFDFTAKWNIRAVPRDDELSREQFSKFVNQFIGPAVLKSVLHLGTLSSDLSPGMPPLIIPPGNLTKTVEVVWDKTNQDD